MAKKTRKQKQRAVTRRPTASPVATPIAADPSPLMAPSETAEMPSGAASVALDPAASDPTRRRVERVAPSAVPVRARPARGQAAGFIAPLESEDAAIPFDRVPYVPADLRRVAIIAALMVALIIVADIIVSNVVK